MKRIPPAERRQLLLDAAFRVMAERGVAAATTRAISAAAGMPLASFHYVFESQQALMAELIRSVVRSEAHAVAPEDLPGNGLREDIEALLLASFEFVREHPGEEQAVQELGHYAMRTPGMDDLVLERKRAAADVLTDVVGMLAQRYGEAKVPLEQIVHRVMAITEGVTAVWLIDRDDEAARDAYREFAAFLVEMVF